MKDEENNIESRSIRKAELTGLNNWWGTVGRERERFWMQSAIEVWAASVLLFRRGPAEENPLGANR